MIKDVNFLGEGKFTKRDEFVKDTLKKILSYKERDNPYGKISLYLDKGLKFDSSLKYPQFRKRTASEIMRSGYLTTCSDFGIVFTTLVREAGIPAMY